MVATPYSYSCVALRARLRRLIREYFSKGMDLSTVATRELRRVEKKLNDRPRKVHGFYTAGEMDLSILTGKPVALGL